MEDEKDELSFLRLYSELDQEDNSNTIIEQEEEPEKYKKESCTIYLKDYLILFACCAVIMLLGYFIFTLLGFYKSSRPIVLAKMASQPFFSHMHRGLIDDNFDGTIRTSRNHRLSVQMLYSPYSITSKHFRGSYFHIAKEIRKIHKNTYPYFGAVNCFDTGGNCRKTYKINKYPILMATSYQEHTSVYNGPLTKHYVSRWINRLQNAVVRITSTEDLINIAKFHDVIAVLFTKFKPTTSDTPTFRNFTQAAFQYLDGDPNTEVSIFCVVTDEQLANILHIYNENDIVILNYELRIISPNVISKWTSVDLSDQMKHFATNSRKKGIEILSVGVRNSASTLLADRIDSGSLLIYFSNSLHYGVNKYNMIKQISREYSNCEEDDILNIRKNDEIIEHQNCTDTVMALSCKRNATLSFMVADSVVNNQLAINFGAEKVDVVIAINSEQEITRHIKGNITRSMIQCLIRQHHQAAENKFVVESSKIVERSSPPQTKQYSNKYGEDSNIRVINDINLALGSQKSTVILFSGGKWHSSSTSALSPFHQTANFFSNYRRFIEFVIVDVTLSDVPFNFNFEKLPKIIVTSPNRSGNSWSYPDELPLNLPNLVRFITSRPSLQLRVLSLMISCDEKCRYRTQLKLRRERAELLRLIKRHETRSLRKLARLGYLNRVILMTS